MHGVPRLCDLTVLELSTPVADAMGQLNISEYSVFAMCTSLLRNGGKIIHSTAGTMYIIAMALYQTSKENARLLNNGDMQDSSSRCL